jgi:hypoxanthine phosphoribosyltransferase
MESMNGSDYTRKETFRCQLITWSEAARMSKELAKRIHASGYNPDIIIAIGRGGYVPGRIVCDYLLFRDLTTIKIEHWGVAATLDKEAHIRFGLSIDISGLKVLVVDDITDTGDTLMAALKYITNQGPVEVKTAVLQHKTCSSYIPDFYVHKIITWRWIIYPWAIFEDLSGFIQRTLEDEYTAEEIQQRLYRDFQLSMDSRSITEVLNQMAFFNLIQKTQINDTILWKKTDNQ